MVAVHVLFTVRPGMADAARPLFAELVEQSRRDAGCMRYEMHAAPDDPNRFLLLELWRSESDLNAHRNQPWFPDMDERLGKTLAREPEMTLWTPLDM